MSPRKIPLLKQTIIAFPLHPRWVDAAQLSLESRGVGDLPNRLWCLKRLKGQHNKGGFTSLIAAMPMLLIEWTLELVRESLTAVSVAQMKAWVNENLATTLASRRTTAYQGFAAATYG